MVTEFVIALYVNDLDKSKAFYVDLLQLSPTFEADWIIQLTSTECKTLKLTLQPKTHSLIPTDFQKSPQGVSIAFVVPDCEPIYQRAVDMGLQIVKEPTNELYGRRRFLTVDPDGLLVDVSSRCEPSPEFIAKYMSG